MCRHPVRKGRSEAEKLKCKESREGEAGVGGKGAGGKGGHRG